MFRISVGICKRVIQVRIKIKLINCSGHISSENLELDFCVKVWFMENSLCKLKRFKYEQKIAY